MAGLAACSSEADPNAGRGDDAGLDAGPPVEAGTDDGGDAGCADDDGFIPRAKRINAPPSARSRHATLRSG